MLLKMQELLAATDPSSKAAIIAEIALNSMPSEALEIARSCVIFHWFDLDIIRSIVPTRSSMKIDEIYEGLEKMPFIEKLPYGLAYHDTTRQGLLIRCVNEYSNQLKRAAKLAAPQYLSRVNDRKSLVEGIYCLTVAGELKTANELRDNLLRDIKTQGEWQLFKDIVTPQLFEKELFPQFELIYSASLNADTIQWFLAHPYGMPSNFTGRVAEHNMLTKWLNMDNEHPLLILRALGGFGKSALTWHWLTNDVDAKQWPKVVFWSFYDGDASFDNFLKETLKYLGVLNVDQMHSHEQMELLLNLLRNPGILLVFDGFERVLRAYSNIGAPDQGDDLQKSKVDFDTSRDCVNLFADVFLDAIGTNGSMLKSKVLMTTRLTPRATKKNGQFLAGVREEELSAMHKNDAVDFFLAQGIRGTHAEIAAACDPYGYHPLSLRILSGWIVNDRANPSDITAVKDLEIAKDIFQNKHHILEISFNSLSFPQKNLLAHIACFRGAVTYDVLKTLNSDGKDVAIFDESLNVLESRGLVHWDRKANKYDLHPIVRRFAYSQLTDFDRTAVHSHLVNYFDAFPKPEKIDKLEDLAPVIELYHHTVRAGKLDEAIKLFYNRLRLAMYFQFGAYQLCIELLQALFLDGEDKLPRLNDENMQTWTLNELANSYALSGQPRRAVALFEMNNDICEKMGDNKNLANGLGNVAGMAQIHIGALREAESNLRRRIDLSHEIADEYEATGHQELGRVLSYRGVWQKAEQELKKSLEFAKKNGHIQMQGITWSYRALHLILMARDNSQSKILNLNLVLRKAGASSTASASRALELADEQAKDYPVPRDYVRAHWLLGAAYCANNELTLAEENLSKALNLCRQINMVDHESNILLELARLRYAQNDFKDAQEKASEALMITERSGYVLQGADVNLFLAQYALEQEKDKAKAKEYAESALKLAYCDGPPYYYKVAYEEAERFLARLKE